MARAVQGNQIMNNAKMGYGARTVKVMELFTFKDGVRLAWVWWTVGHGERYSVKVEELEAKAVR